METYYTIEQWTKANRNAFSWYYENYPFLKNFTLPIERSVLLDFYIKDYNKRNLKTSNQFANVYEFLFSYFLENYPKQNDETRFKGKTGLGYFVDNIPAGFKKTFVDFKTSINSVFDFSKYGIIIIAVIIGLFLIFKIKK